MCSQTSYSAPGVNFNLATWILHYAVLDTFFSLGESRYIFYQRKNCYHKCQKLSYQYENAAYQEFDRVFCWLKNER